MRKQTRSKIIILLVVCFVIYLLLLNKVDQIGNMGGDWGIITTTITGYLPHIVGILLGFIFILKDVGNRSTSTGRLFLLTSVVGILFSSLFYELNEDGIWIDEIVTASFTITDLQIVIILFFILIGIIVGLIKK